MRALLGKGGEFKDAFSRMRDRKTILGTAQILWHGCGYWTRYMSSAATVSIWLCNVLVRHCGSGSGLANHPL